MNYEIKVLRGFEASNYVIMFIRGAMDLAAFCRVFNKLGETTQTFRDCKTLIDFQDSNCKFLPCEFSTLEIGLQKWPRSHKIAFVSSPDKEQFRHLVNLGNSLVRMKLDVSVFYEMRNAITWLAKE
jgi:hypothetical protein